MAYPKKERIIPTSKECKYCRIVKPIDDFYIKNSAPDLHCAYCKDCTRLKTNQYRHKNPERVKAINLKTRIKNREKLRERNRQFYAKVKNDPEHILARKMSWEKHHEKHNERARQKREEFNKTWKHPCEKCGESRLYLIQFHHIDPNTKKFCIGSCASAKHTEELTEEVKKCVCLCSNCHDEFHYFYGNKPKNPVEALQEYLTKDKEKKA